MNLNRRIRTLLYEDQLFTDFEIDLLHTPALQRLYDLHQLGYTDRVFVDASHSRLHHVVGVVEQADKIILAIARNLRKHPTAEYRFGDEKPGVLTGAQLSRLTRKRRAVVRLMGLLHDLSHTPYGHTLEDEIRLIRQSHDQPERQADAFYRLVIQYLAWVERNETRRSWGPQNSNQPTTDDARSLLDWYLDAPEIHPPPVSAHFIESSAKRWAKMITDEPDATKHLRRISPPALGASLRDLSFAIRALLHLQSAHKDPEKVEAKHLPAPTYFVLQLLEKIFHFAGKPLLDEERFDPNRDAYLLDVIGNTICADLLDYARRDAAHAGLKLAYDPQRIIGSMTVVQSQIVHHEIQSAHGAQRFPFNNQSLRTAVSIFSHKLRLDVPGELLNLLQVRFFVYERVLFHPTKCVAGAMLGAAMQNIGWKTLPPHWNQVGDAVLLKEAREAGRCLRDILRSLAEQDSHFGIEHADLINSRLEKFPVAGVTEAVRHWVRDRSKITWDEIKEQLDALSKIYRYHGPVVAIQKELLELEKSSPNDIPFARWPAIRTALEKAAQKGGWEAGDVIRILFPTVGGLCRQTEDGLRLLDRLGARRFHKVVFRLLSNAPTSNGGPTDLTPGRIAKEFGDAVTRKYVEWEIADKAKIPRGTVVIHCPPAAGPTKIANILMTDGRNPKTPKLRDLKVLDEHIFEHHQIAVTTLENMYKSTWRLSVSVAPPYDSQWKQLDPVIGEVLFQALGGAGKLKNDLHMIRELEGQVTAVKENYERDKIANRGHLVDEEDLIELATGIAELMTEIGTETDGNPQEILAELRHRITSPELTRPFRQPDRDAMPDSGIWTNQKAGRERLNSAFGPLFKSDRRSALIYGRMVALTPTQQRWLDTRLEEHAFRATDSRVVTPNEKDTMFERVEALIEEAKSIE
jgi:HD superfamily phosphohydrolase